MEKKLGKGAFGEVYKAKCENAKYLAANKIEVGDPVRVQVSWLRNVIGACYAMFTVKFHATRIILRRKVEPANCSIAPFKLRSYTR